MASRSPRDTKGGRGRKKDVVKDRAEAPTVGSVQEPGMSRGDGSADLPSRLFDTWAALFSAAATVAEKELAVGIKAAQFVERRLLEVDVLRSDGSSDLMVRWRRDAHDVLDMMMDVVNVSVSSFSGQAGSILGIKAKPQAPTGPPSGEHVIVVRMPGPLAPGQTGERVLELRNDGEEPTHCALRSSDLTSDAGARIGADQVYFHPPQLMVAPRDTGELVVGVAVPEGTPGGRYEGLLQGLPGSAQRTLLQVHVL